MNICGGQAVHIPVTKCEDCDDFLQRLETIEELLNGVRRVTISKSDGDSSQSGFFLGEVTNG